MTNYKRDVKIDPDTNMPDVPDDLFWRVARYHLEKNAYDGSESQVESPPGKVSVSLMKRLPTRSSYEPGEKVVTFREVAEKPAVIKKTAIAIWAEVLAVKAERARVVVLDKKILGDFPPKELNVPANRVLEAGSRMGGTSPKTAKKLGS